MNKRRKKILISIDWFLPGTKSGGPVRSYANLLEHLNEDFEFLIITRNTDYGSTVPYPNVESNTWVNLNPYTRIFYLSKNNINKKFLAQLYKSVDFDVAYINGVYSWYFSILPVLLIKKLSKPIIISSRGMLNPQAFSVKRRKKKIYISLAKIISLYKGVAFHATNAEEAKYIKNELGDKVDVLIAPNLPRKLSTGLPSKLSKHNPVKFVNVARIAREKGTLIMLQGLRAFKEPLELDLFGPIYDNDYWFKCQEVINNLPKYISVKYKGVLHSDDVPMKLKEYDFFVMLSEGENFGHAILEALSVGLPVIISNKTPWVNLESKQIGWDINIYDDKIICETFSKAISMSTTTYADWSKNAFNFGYNFMNDPILIEQNKALFLKTIENK